MRSTEYFRFPGTAISTSGSSYWACHGHCGFPAFGRLVCSVRRPSLSGLLVGLPAAIVEYGIFFRRFDLAFGVKFWLTFV